MFTIDQQLRYARHLVLPRFGAEAQAALMKSSVLIVGAGGLGSPAAFYLAAAGVGRIGIIDDDVVDLSNLQRQILHRTQDTGVLKVESARRAIGECNPEVTVIPIAERLGENNARSLIREYDVVLDATDNFPTRYLVNDAAVLETRPVVHGSIYHYEGQLAVFRSPDGPCYRCLFPEPPEPGTIPSCAEAGVLGVLPGVVGTLQATETIKLLTGIGQPLIGRMAIYDALKPAFRTLTVRKDLGCPLCGERPTITEASMLDWECELPDPDVPQIDVTAYHGIRESQQQYLLLDVREAREVEAGCIDGCVHIPVGQLEERIHELDGWQEKLVVCQCQSGIRSQRAAALLRKSGFHKVANLAGGYLAWLGAIQTET